MSGKGAMFDRPGHYLLRLFMVARALPARAPDMILGAGNGGQRVVILPSLGVVVVTTAGLYGDEASGLTALTTLNKFIFPAAIEH